MSEMANRGEEEARWIDGAAGGDFGDPQPFNLVKLLGEVEFDDDGDLEALELINMNPDLSIDAFGKNDVVSTPKRKTGELISYRNMAHRLTTSISHAWDSYTRTRAKKYNRLVILEYILRLVALYDKQPIPPEISAVIDAIIGNDEAGTIENLISAKASDDLSKMDMFSKSIYLEPYPTSVLRMLLKLAIEILPYIGNLTSKIREQLSLEGLVHAGTPEYELSVNSYTKMLRLLKQLEVLQSVIREYLPKFKNYEVILDASKISVAWLQEKGLFSRKEITFSVAHQMGLVYETTYESLIKMVSCICCLIEVPEIDNYQYSKLLLVSLDFILIMRELRDGLETVVSVYESAVDLLRRESILSRDMSPLCPSYEREDRLKRQCGHIVSWATEFAEHARLLQETAERVAQLKSNREEEGYKKAIKELQELQGATESKMKQFLPIMTTHSILLASLIPKVTISPEVSDQGKAIHNNKNKDAAPSTSSNEPNVEDPTEFANVASEADTAEEAPMENRDEVFLRIGGSDENGQDAFNEPEQFDDESRAHMLFSGVVNQLKNALIPVKNEMKQREKEAMKKFYRSMTGAEMSNFKDIDGDDAEEEEEPAMEDLNANPVDEISDGAAALAVVAPKKKVNKYSAMRDEEETDIPTSTTFAGIDFMKELTSKMRTASELCFLAEGEEDELICDPFSEEDTVVEENGENKSETNEN